VLLPPWRRSVNDVKVVPYSWVVFAVITASRTIGTGLAFMCVPPFMTTISEEMHLSSEQVGAVWGMVTLGTLFFVLLGGLISDRIGVRWAGTLGLFVMLIGGTMRGTAESYQELLVAMLVFGIGFGIVTPNPARSLAQWFPPNRLGMVNGIGIAGTAIGSALAMGISYSHISPWVGGWRNVMFLMAGLIFLSAAAWALLVKERLPGGRGGLSLGMVFKGLVWVGRMKSVWLMSLVLMLVMGAHMAWSGHMPGFFENKHGLTKAAAGAMASIPFFSGIVFTVFAPTVSDRIGRRKPLLLVACLMGVVLNLIQGSFVGLPLVIILVLIAFTVSTVLPLLLAIPFELKELPQAAAGAALGIMFTVGNLGGFVLPILAGKLIDMLAPTYFPFLAMMGACSAVSLLLISLFPETGPRAQGAVVGSDNVREKFAESPQ
jgi:nitrate/nitrite transporter NarK